MNTIIYIAMILEAATHEAYGYYPKDLKSRSGKRWYWQELIMHKLKNTLLGW